MSQKALLLPPDLQGQQTPIDEAARQIVIVGANGAGKSRFTARMIEDAGPKAFPLSALQAIFDRTEGPSGNPVIDNLFDEASTKGMPHAPATTQLDRVLALLMRDEMLNLIGFKLARRESRNAELRHTRLDTVIDLWEQIFPGSRVLIESGRILFAREIDGDNDQGYSASRLSAGEKAVLYYLGAISYAPKRSIIFVDSPEIFLHPTVTNALWNHLEMLRPDCRMVYTTHDLDFAASRSASSVVWVRQFDARTLRWDYRTLPAATVVSDEIYRSILGSRKPVLFIEGDGRHSIDSKLYPLIFSDFTVQPLGSCNKVIEATRTFNDLNAFHHMDSRGIVDRDRRDSGEVDYLRRKRIMVPEVAEVENLLLVEEVIRTVASSRGKDENVVASKVKRWIIGEFRRELRQQALLHTRHRVKRLVECRIDGRFPNIESLERHMAALPHEINPRNIYEHLCNEFQAYATRGDYPAILRVYNQKSMLPGCNVAGLCGFRDKDEYLHAILSILRTDTEAARRIRSAITACFRLDPTPINQSSSADNTDNE